MPYQHNENRRHKIKKPRYKVTNWHNYNNGLRQRGDVTIRFTEEAIADWHPEKTGARGRPQEYSDITIFSWVMVPTMAILNETGIFKLLLRMGASHGSEKQKH